MSLFRTHLFRCQIEEMAPGFVKSHNPGQKVVSLCARWACLEESMARSLTVISLLFQSTTHCRYRVYTKFLLTYTVIYRRNRKVLPLGITALHSQSHFHLDTPYMMGCCTESWTVTNFQRNLLPKSSLLRCYKSAKDNFHFLSFFLSLFLYFLICFLLRVLFIRIMYIKVTLYWGYLTVLWLFHLVCILYCGCFNFFRNVWVCVCVSFVMCGCFGNMCTCIYCFLRFVMCFFELFLLCVFILICFVCTSVRTTATEWQLNCS